MTSVGAKGRCGPAMRMQSAPCSASVRPQVGPASTRVRSSTRMPASGLSPPRGAVFGPSPMRSIDTGGSAASARPCGWAAHSSGVRVIAPQRPAAAIASSNSCPPRPATAAANASFSASAPSSASIPSRWCGKLQCRKTWRPSPVGQIPENGSHREEGAAPSIFR